MSTPRQDETIDITRYAEVMGHLRYFPVEKHTEVIARPGIHMKLLDIIMDFEGDAYHICTQAQVATGPSSDVVNLLGKAGKRLRPNVVIWWEGYTLIDWTVGAGATMTKGMILPTPAGQKPYWPPRIPL